MIFIRAIKLLSEMRFVHAGSIHTLGVRESISFIEIWQPVNLKKSQQLARTSGEHPT